jgi:hypothetical protein
METPYDQDKVKEAFDTIKAAMVADEPKMPGSYAHSWHCNIAMAVYDAWGPVESDSVEQAQRIKVANDAASRFMKMCFGVDTKA